MKTETDRDIRVRDLPAWEPTKQVQTPTGIVHIEPNHPLMYCPDCGREASANPADYFAAHPDTLIACCGESMRLVYKRTRYEDA